MKNKTGTAEREAHEDALREKKLKEQRSKDKEEEKDDRAHYAQDEPSR